MQCRVRFVIFGFDAFRQDFTDGAVEGEMYLGDGEGAVGVSAVEGEHWAGV